MAKLRTKRTRPIQPEPWSRREAIRLSRLCTPGRVQAFLDAIAYNDEITCRSPRRVMRDRKAHCMEGALMAAAALAHHGYPPLLVDLRAARERDDDHVIALFQVDGRFGAVAKSNFSGLRYRSPIYASLRELAASYFDVYYNLEGKRTLRSYSTPLLLTDRLFPGWLVSEANLDEIGEKLDTLRHYPLLTNRMVKRLIPVDKRTFDAGLLGSNRKGLFRS